MSSNLPPTYTADNIQVLEGLDAVRMRPSMYIGDTSTRGLHHLFIEVIDNSIDEVLNGYADEISVTLGADKVITVTDNGRGIPTDIHQETGKSGVEVAMTILHAGGKFGGGGYKVSGGLHGVGVSVVNALASWCEVTVARDGTRCRQRYERGVPVTGLEVLEKTKDHGTTTRWLADPDIFGDYEYDPQYFISRIRELAYLNKGAKFIFTNETADEEDEERVMVFQYKLGIAAFVEHLNRNKAPLHRPIYFQKDRDDVDIEVALQYNDTFQDHILTFANNIKTHEGGTHLSGFKTALTRMLNQYARKQGLLKEKDRNFSGDDVREGAAAVISVKLLNPQFEGQTKTKLGNSEVEGLVNSVVGEALATYFEEHPAVVKRICEKAVTAQRARDAARKASELVKRQSALESTSLPGRLSDCSERDPQKCELYLVEGVSAGGSAKNGRDRRFQAILPLRGKVLNVEKARVDKALSNIEIRSLITAVGIGISSGVTGKSDGGDGDSEVVNGNGNGNGNGSAGDSLDMSKLRYDKIIIMTDADVDGSHIRMLLLTFFFRYMGPLISDGHVYIAQPPLFRLKSGKETVYAKDDAQRIEIQANAKRKYEVTRFKGLGEMEATDLWDTTMNPDNRTLLKVTIDDFDEASQLFSDLMGECVESRREFIERRAKDVVNLDI